VFILVFALVGVIVLIGGFLALPFLFGSSGALTAFVRPDLVVIFHGRASGKGGPFDSLLIATRTQVFCVPHRRLSELPQFVAWVAGGDPWQPTSSRAPLKAWTAEGLEDAFRQRLSDPGLSAIALEEAAAAYLPPESRLVLASLATYRVETRAPRGFCYQLPGGGSHARVPIQSEADALALHRLIA
jgi:hypothetical protein